jgi:hypothetical protein
MNGYLELRFASPGELTPIFRIDWFLLTNVSARA